MKHSGSCAGPLRGTTPRCPPGLSTGWIFSQGSLFPVSPCSSVNFGVKNGLSFEQSTQCSIYFPLPGSPPPSSKPAPTRLKFSFMPAMSFPTVQIPAQSAHQPGCLEVQTVALSLSHHGDHRAHSQSGFSEEVVELCSSSRHISSHQVPTSPVGDAADPRSCADPSC